MRFPSRAKPVVAAVGLAGVVLLPLPNVLPLVAASANVIVAEGRTIPEDYYVSGAKVIVEGVIEGDLIAAAGELTVTGRVDGDVIAIVWGNATIGGEVTGAVRVAARSLDVDGTVGDDVAAVVVFSDLSGDIGRDLLMAGLSVGMTGSIGRDLLGQYWQLDLDGAVGRDVDISVRSLEVGASTEVGDDLVYRSGSSATISGGAVVGGQVVEQRSRTPIALKAIQRLVSVLSVLAFLFAGIALLWVFRRTAPRATSAVRLQPVRTFLLGVVTLIGVPLLTVPLALTLVGIPLAALLVIVWVLALFLGPIPAVTAVGEKVMRGRGGIYGGFVIGALVWRLGIFVIPILGFVLYFAALIWGVGGWVQGAWEARRDDEPAPELPVKVDESWEGPLPPHEGESDNAGGDGE